ARTLGDRPFHVAHDRRLHEEPTDERPIPGCVRGLRWGSLLALLGGLVAGHRSGRSTFRARIALLRLLLLRRRAAFAASRQRNGGNPPRCDGGANRGDGQNSGSRKGSARKMHERMREKMLGCCRGYGAAASSTAARCCRSTSWPWAATCRAPHHGQQEL